MVGKQVKGRRFCGVLNYVLNPEKGMLIGSNMDGLTARELAREFAESRKLNPDLKRPVYYVSLSLPPGERLNDFQWNQIADRYLDAMGFKLSQFVVARHTDTDHDHVHIIASRIGLDAKTVSDSQDYKRSEEAIREIEREYGLTEVISSRNVERRGLTSGELRLALKTQQPSIKMKLQEIIDQAAKQSPTISIFVRNLDRRGVRVIPNMAANGRISGISFDLNGEIMKGSDLGKGYSFLGLQKRGISYDQSRDNEAFKAKKHIMTDMDWAFSPKETEANIHAQENTSDVTSIRNHQRRNCHGTGRQG